MYTSQYWIDRLKLQRHPEGGWFREVYRSSESIAANDLPERFTGDRSYSTAIYFLLMGDEYSAFHRIKQDELWHFYEGSTAVIHCIDPNGDYREIRVGKEIENQEEPMAVIPAGDYFAAEVVEKNSYALVGCTVAPGFDFDDFEMPNRQDLLTQFPQHAPLIRRLTRDHK